MAEMTEEDKIKWDLQIAKIQGNPYTTNGVNISFTKDDAVGMLQVKAAFEMGLPSTNIKFSNGTVLPMTTQEFPSFAVWFVNERNKFFV